MRQEEHAEQTALFYWMWLNRAKHPALELAFAIPNGGHRHISVAKKLKAEGVKAGVPDIFLPWPKLGSQWTHGPYGDSACGLFIEMKSENGRESPEQQRWIYRLKESGYHAEVCYSWQEAARMIVDYLGLDPKACGL